MLGYTSGSRSFRAPSLVLSARHGARSSSADGGAPAAASTEDEAAAAAATAGGSPSIPAVALGRQAGQQPEEVLLFVGIIDFLQVG
jgi:hypothetical protein